MKTGLPVSPKKEGLPADYFSEKCIYYDSSSHQLWAGSKIH
jgi:hypothetical protein